MIGCRGFARLVGLWASAGAIAGLPLRASERGQTPVIAQQIETARVLELGDHYTPSAIAKAHAYYEQVRAKSGVDARAQYALALVLIRQHSHKEALELLDGIVGRDPAALHAWRAKLWVEMAAHNEREVLTDVRRLTNVLARQPASSPAHGAKDRKATAEFLGRVFGFLALRHAGALPAEEVHTARQYVLERLGDEQILFKQHEKSLVQESFEAEAARTHAFASLRAVRIAEATSKREDYATQIQAVDEAEADLDYDTETAKLAAKAELDNAIQAVANMSTKILASQFRLNVMREQIQFNRANVAFYPTQDLFSQRQAERALRRQINGLINVFPSTVARSEWVFSQAGNNIELLAAQAAVLKRKERRLEGLEQAEAKKIATLRQTTLTMKQMSFAALEPFPFDTEKDRVREMADQ